MKSLNIRSLRSKIMLLFIIFASLILILQMGVFQQWIRSIILEKSETYFQGTVYQIGQRVDMQFEQFGTMALGIGNNQVVKNYLADLKGHSISYTIAKYKISYEILRASKLSWIENMCIYPVDGQPPINLYYSVPVFEADAVIRGMQEDPSTLPPDRILWKPSPEKPGQAEAYLPIQENGERYGILRISLSESFFRFLDDVKLGKEGDIYLTNGDTVLYVKDRSHIGSSMERLRQAAGSVAKEQYAMSEPGWTLVGIVPQKETLQLIHEFNRIFLLMVIVILAAIMSFAVMSARAILLPLHDISKGMKRIQQGDLNVRLAHKGDDEFGELTFQFNYMVDRVKELIETVFQQQRKHRQAEIVSLLSKLNPHFLYNSLDMIYWKAIMKGEEEIGSSIVALSNILRYSISHSGDFVTVREDMGQLESYLTIQSMRFQDKWRYCFDIREDIGEDKIPKLVIQPLVENAIKYAFHPAKQDGYIAIRGYRSGEDLIFEVEDNGVGIAEEKANRLLRVSESEDGADEMGLGIPLVHRRARYLYGEGYGITIRSAAGQGTTITVRLGGRIESDLLAAGDYGT
ncbi:two-component system sensor histidine kinase YesM [Paenibacillus rhizosphaerae]|uniref:histidine kinase n=1 Tax=Paenibacillus rhizosphaerae TaxID=297318 RepID=A0A839TPL8_9BACL|nr:sensor histidine kinase [Paenibacillus rhizosphaerae]MBB3128511.1 two-component system sensor histidine kinase YesM [Paenibacillus rhizosphaerae]